MWRVSPGLCLSDVTVLVKGITDVMEVQGLLAGSSGSIEYTKPAEGLIGEIMVSANPKALNTHLLNEFKKQQTGCVSPVNEKTEFVTQLLASHSFPTLETINEYLLVIIRLTALIVQNGKSSLFFFFF